MGGSDRQTSLARFSRPRYAEGMDPEPDAMIEQAVTADTPQPADAPRVQALEQRVRHLEDVVAALQDTRALEERVAERVTARVGPAQGDGARPSAGLLRDAGRLAHAVGALAGGAVAVAAPAPAPPVLPEERRWLLVEVYAEFRALLRMYLDRRYRRSWAAWLLPPLLVAAIATSWIWIPGTGILPGTVAMLIMKVVDLVLAFVLWKVLHREVSHYRATSPDLPPSLRL
jgi:hypothetical protein